MGKPRCRYFDVSHKSLHKIALETQVIIVITKSQKRVSFVSRSRSFSSLAKQRLPSRAHAPELVLLLPDHQLEQCRPLSSVVFGRRGIRFRLVRISYFSCSFFLIPVYNSSHTHSYILHIRPDRCAGRVKGEFIYRAHPVTLNIISERTVFA